MIGGTKKMKRLNIDGNSDTHTNIVCAVLADKYPELLDMKGKFSYEHIPLTKESIQYTNALREEYRKENELFFDEKKIDLIINAIVEMYEPVVERVRVRFEKIKKNREIEKKFYQTQTKKRFEIFIEQAKIFSKESKELNKFLESNENILDVPTSTLFNEQSFSMSDRLDRTCESMEYILNTNYK